MTEVLTGSIEKKKGRRGSALVNVLALASVLCVLGFVVASMSTADLGFAATYRVHVQNEQLARAAITQFTYEADQATLDQSPLEAAPPIDWRARFANNPVFPGAHEHLPGTVSVTFDPTLSNFSVDNSDNTQPAASWSDRGTTRKSIPPYSVSLVLKVNTGGQSDVFEAVLQRRWPYLLASPGPIRVLGAPSDSSTSCLTGSVYCLNETLSIPDSSTFSLDPPHLTTQLAARLAALRGPNASASQLVLGGLIGENTANVDSTGNQLIGNVDFAAPNNGEAGVQVSSNNQWRGNQRFSVISQKDTVKLGKALVMPSPSGYTEISPLPPTLEPSDTVDPTYPARTKPILFMTNDTVLGPPSQSDSPAFRHSSAAKILVNSSLSNTRQVYDPAANPAVTTIYSNGRCLELQNCALYVNGDLSLERPGGTSTGPSLRGSNATIIVNGTLSLSEASIDAQSQGMVILCRYLLCQATGYFRGLVLVQSGAVFYPRSDPTLAPMEIHGSLVVGGRGTFANGGSTNANNSGNAVALPVGASGQAPPPPSDQAALPPSAQSFSAGQAMAAASMTPGLTLWSSKVNYDARYVLTLNGLGKYEVLSLRRLP